MELENLSKKIMSMVKFEDLAEANKDARKHPFRIEFLTLGWKELSFLIPDEMKDFSEVQSLITLSALPHTDTLGYENHLFANLVLQGDYLYGDRNRKPEDEISIKVGNMFFVESDVEHWAFPSDVCASSDEIEPLILAAVNINMNETDMTREEVKKIIEGHWLALNPS